jgi:hypothetical protein
LREKIETGLLLSVGALSACASLFFCYYTLRLAYLGATGMIDAAHRTAGLRIGAAVFPAASFTFGWLSLACFRRTSVRTAVRRFRSSSSSTSSMAARTRTTIPSGWDSDS